jgi:hypothetical protein
MNAHEGVKFKLIPVLLLNKHLCFVAVILKKQERSFINDKSERRRIAYKSNGAAQI